MLTSILLQANAGGSAGIMNLIFIVGIIVVFYFFMIRPQQKKQKEIRKAREAMKAGSKIVTAGGIYGRIIDVKETSFMVEIDKGVVIKIDKGSVYPSAEDAAFEQAKK